MSTPQTVGFLDIPVELRLDIYEMVLVYPRPLIWQGMTAAMDYHLYSLTVDRHIRRSQHLLWQRYENNQLECLRPTSSVSENPWRVPWYLLPQEHISAACPWGRLENNNQISSKSFARTACAARLPQGEHQAGRSSASHQDRELTRDDRY